MVGPTIVEIFSFGVKPSGMKNIVIRPQAMIAPMLGMIMLDRNVPNFWTWTRALVRGAGVVTVEAIWVPLVVPGRDARHGRDGASLHTIGHVAKYSGRFSCPLMWSFLRSGTSVTSGCPVPTRKEPPRHEGTALLCSRGRPARGRRRARLRTG